METFWESFRLDPRLPSNAPMRASDADREIVRGALADAYADGRLTGEEYEGRQNSLYSSRTLGELSAFVTDLVPSDGSSAVPAPLRGADLRARGARKWRKEVEESFGAFFVPSLICTVIWIAAGRNGFFWPMYPMLFLGINLVRTVIRREAVIEREVLRLEEQASGNAIKNPSADRDDPDPS
jgi:uncharacterized protein DUF1707